MTVYHHPWMLIPDKLRSVGGRETDRFRGIVPAKDIPNGAEAWVGSVTRANGTTPEHPNLGCSEVLMPDGTRKYLFELINESPEMALGKNHLDHYGTDLGVLVKLLDAKNTFLLQCHPTKETAGKLWNSKYGKEECWYVISIRDDEPEPPYILLGFKEGISRKLFEQTYRNGSLEDVEKLCHKIPVYPGESYFIPGGVPHALGPGCFVAEIQEPSDVTAVPITQEELLAFRRRSNPLGKFYPEDNEIYEQRMLNSFHYDGFPLEKILELYKGKEPVFREEGNSYESEIFGTEYTDAFSCTMVRVNGRIRRIDTEDAQIIIILSGKGRIICDKFCMEVKQGNEIFMPASVRNAIFEGNMTAILCNPGITAKYKIID